MEKIRARGKFGSCEVAIQGLNPRNWPRKYFELNYHIEHNDLNIFLALCARYFGHMTCNRCLIGLKEN